MQRNKELYGNSVLQHGLNLSDLVIFSLLKLHEFVSSLITLNLWLMFNELGTCAMLLQITEQADVIATLQSCVWEYPSSYFGWSNSSYDGGFL
jgi:hypothetical protein